MTLLTGLLGYPLGHSVSPAMHNAAFQALGLDGRYDALPTPPERLAETVAGLAAAGYRGVNVTIPHKQAVMPLLDGLSEAAQAIGAVNTIIVQRFSKSLAGQPGTDDLENRPTVLRTNEGVQRFSKSLAGHGETDDLENRPTALRTDEGVQRFSKSLAGHGETDDLENRPTVLRGDNTDWLGFLHPLDAACFDLAGKSALLLGAGGSARAVVYALLQRGLAHLTISARTPARAVELAHHAHTLAPSLTIHPFTNSPLTIHPFTNSPFTISPDLIINTTPLGMWPHVDASPWPDELPMPRGTLVYDLVYRPERTLFLQQAEAAGCAVQGGLEMLVVQGAAAFELWTGQKPPLEVMLTAARAALIEVG